MASPVAQARDPESRISRHSGSWNSPVIIYSHGVSPTQCELLGSRYHSSFYIPVLGTVSEALKELINIG